MGKKKKVTKPAEDKHEKFLRVATPRINKALKAIGLIGNQAAAGYAPTDEEVADLFAVLRKKVDEVEKCYQSSSKQSVAFSFNP